MVTIKPMDDRLLVEMDTEEETFGGGRFVIVRIPDKEWGYEPRPRRGTVLAVGPNVQDTGVGDYVVWTKFNGVEMPNTLLEDGQRRNMMMVREQFVLVRMDSRDNVQFGKSYEKWPGDRGGRNIDDRRGREIK